MIKIYLIIVLLCLKTLSSWSQITISGTVKDEKGNAAAGANVYVKGGYDGASADANGNFSFTIDGEGEIILLAALIGFEQQEKKVILKEKLVTVNFSLREKSNELNTVIITAGAFEASDERKIVMLRPLDIVTTAGAAGDIYGALQTLPGTQRIGESEGLFVRGGEARESKTFIDGILVDNPYFTSVPDVPQRGRFSPFLFKGTFFSTGGYSAQYGQAMSSALILESQDMPEKTTTNIGIMSVGGGAGHIKRYKNTSVGVNANYYNLEPYFLLASQKRDWHTAPQGGDVSLTVRHKTSQTGLLKFFINGSIGKLSLDYDDIENPEPDSKYRFALTNKNFFSQVNYKAIIAGKYSLQIATAFSANNDDLDIDANVAEKENRLYQNKIVISRPVSELSTVRVGGEYQHVDITDQFNIYKRDFTNDFGAVFAEGDIYITRKLVSRVGFRGERSSVIDEMNLSPRLSLAYKTGDYSQFSFAYGTFYQQPDYTFVQQQKELDFEQAEHYIVNFQRVTDKRTFRVEGYYKQYDALIKTEPAITNTGDGYARGIDVFWRDKKTLKYTDFWMSYSYLETKRNYLDYPEKVSPPFAANHTVSVVYKRWFPKQRLSAGFTYGFSSGRPYDSPNDDAFMAQRTKPVHTFSINASKLMMIGRHFTVLVASIDNVLGIDNVYTYRYSSNGMRKQAVGPPAKRFYFIGMFMTIGEDKAD